VITNHFNISRKVVKLEAVLDRIVIGEFWDLGFRSRQQMRQTRAIFFGTKFMVKYWYAKHENREYCPQHGALNPFFAGSAFSAVTIAVSEPFLLPTVENWYPFWRYVLAPGSYPNIYRQTTMAIGLESQHGALTPFSARLHLATSGFKS
jgi:hypothetical protein